MEKASVKLNRLEEEEKKEIEDVLGGLSGEFITHSTEEITFGFHSVK